MRCSLLLLTVVALGLSYDITFVNKCQNVVNVQYEPDVNNKCTARLLTALTVGQASTFTFDNFGEFGAQTFRSGSNGKTFAQTHSDGGSVGATYGLTYEISVEQGFDVAMQFETKSPTANPSEYPGGVIKCVDASCNSGWDWFGNTQKWVREATVNEANFTLTFCP